MSDMLDDHRNRSADRAPRAASVADRLLVPVLTAVFGALSALAAKIGADQKSWSDVVMCLIVIAVALVVLWVGAKIDAIKTRRLYTVEKLAPGITKVPHNWEVVQPLVVNDPDTLDPPVCLTGLDQIPTTAS